ncbi:MULTISPECIES: DUF3872 domain-containing protein [Flavobacteriales]|jgi:hypothetical protein|uniref:DUF3872 domain-containing protein n=1 Tax=Flavobacteriales TaxID=200644 RepID=UPI0005B29647|nr:MULTISPECIES: DUF3872 domain-containing protein [Flavobacteriales]UOU98209.1 DUF3872 domain-containing protein [Chryseobacterium daecheongense]WFB67488.1 DUF3872 domain-containing protein [Chryseobacterium sp. WX]
MQYILNHKFKLLLGCFIIPVMILLLIQSCEKDNLEIQQNFPFEVEVMPVQKYISKGETIEIRCRIIPGGNYAGTTYSIRYFQSEGVGSLRLFDNPSFVPNDFYPLSKKEFRLYYTSESSVSQSFDIWISDNMGNKQEVNFQFNPQSIGTL